MTLHVHHTSLFVRFFVDLAWKWHEKCLISCFLGDIKKQWQNLFYLSEVVSRKTLRNSTPGEFTMLRFNFILWMKPQFANADSKTTTSQQTISGYDKHLSGQTFGLLVILTGHVKKWLEKNTFSHHYISRRQASFCSLFFLLVGLVRSSYYSFIFNILSGQKREETWKFLWPVNMTSNSPKFILNPSMPSTLHADVLGGFGLLGRLFNAIISKGNKEIIF